MDPDNLLPPEFPEVRIWFRHDHTDVEQKFHRDCPGAVAWHAEICHTFPSFAVAIHSLVSEEETYWCLHCGRGLFSQLVSRSVTCKYLNMEIVCGPYPLFIKHSWQKEINTLHCERRPGSPFIEAEPFSLCKQPLSLH